MIIQISQEELEFIQQIARKVNKKPRWIDSDTKTMAALFCIAKYLRVDPRETLSEKRKTITVNNKTIAAKNTKVDFGYLLYKEKQYFNTDYVFLCMVKDDFVDCDIICYATKEEWEEKAELVDLKFGPTFQLKQNEMHSLGLKMPELGLDMQVDIEDDNIPF